MRIACLGPEWTFSHIACCLYFGDTAEIYLQNSIPSVFEAINDGQADVGLIPFRNSDQGMVKESLLAFSDFQKIFFHDRFAMPIEHCLISSNKDLSGIAKLFTIEQAYKQSEDWILRNLPQTEICLTNSSADGIRKAAELADSAAIGSEKACEHYGLNILARSIQNSRDNMTQFCVVSKELPAQGKVDFYSSTFLVSTVGDEAVRERLLMLISDLEVFAESFVFMPKANAELLFIDDIDGFFDHENIQNAFTELGNKGFPNRLLGSFSIPIKILGL